MLLFVKVCLLTYHRFAAYWI